MSENNNLDFIQELGIGSEDATPSDAESNNSNNVSNEDLHEDSNTEESKQADNQNTEPDVNESLRKQIEGLEKRISDKDEYINTLREQSKAKEESSNTEEVGTDFWDDPESIVKDMQQTIKLQQMQIQETVYANTVENYWKTVNPEALQQAVATDTEFAKKFNASSEPYKDAYEYLSNKAKKVETEQASLKEQIRAELMKEMGLDKPKKEGVPNMGSMGSGGSKSEAPSDGFSSVFGQS